MTMNRDMGMSRYGRTGGMAANRQIRVNHLDAGSSTGPRTERGNALRHGLPRANLVVLAWEDAATFKALRCVADSELRTLFSQFYPLNH